MTLDLELTDDAGFLLLAVRNRWRQRVCGGLLYAVCPATGRGLAVAGDALTELEDARLVVIPAAGDPRAVLTPRGYTYARLLALDLCGDRNAVMKLKDGEGEELPPGDA